LNKKILPWILPVIIIVIWYIATVPLHLVETYIMPNPYMVVDAGYELIISGQLLQDTISTLTNVFCGLILGTVVGVSLGVLLGWSKTLEDMSSVVVGVLRPIPPVAWIPFSILWFGIGLLQASILIFIGCVFPILIYTIDGVKRTDKVLIEAGNTLGTNNFQTITKIVFPSALPTIITGTKVGVGIALMCTVSAEMVSSGGTGLGHLILTASQVFNTGAVVIGMATIGVIGICFDLLFRYLQNRIFW